VRPFRQPLVTIAIPSYNCAAYVAEAVRSALSQTYEHIEVVAVDDCSTDASVEILRGIRDPRFRLFVNDRNLGLEGNWNRCLELAEGEYMTLLPSDDLLYPSAVAEKLAVLESEGSEDIAFAYSARDVIDRQGRKLVRAKFSRGGRIGRSELVRSNVRHGMNVIGEPGAVLFRTNLGRRAGGFSGELSYLIDLSFWLGLLEFGDAYAFAETQCAFRLTGYNLSFRLGKQRRSDYLSLIDRLAHEGTWLIRWSDVRLGKARVYLNEFLRSLLYKYLTTTGCR
jgi:glycosyltransferase involved in cell wall biosynthesis